MSLALECVTCTGTPLAAGDWLILAACCAVVLLPYLISLARRK